MVTGFQLYLNMCPHWKSSDISRINNFDIITKHFLSLFTSFITNRSKTKEIFVNMICKRVVQSLLYKKNCVYKISFLHKKMENEKTIFHQLIMGRGGLKLFDQLDFNIIHKWNVRFFNTMFIFLNLFLRCHCVPNQNNY